MALKVCIYSRDPRRTKGGVCEHLVAFGEGLQRHGITPIMLPANMSEACDLAVVWGYRKHVQMSTGKRAMIMERGYVGDRFYWTSIGYDGLNGYADFCNQKIKSPERWDKLFARYMRPWRGHHDGSYVLILTQVPGDASLRGMDTHAWARGLVAEFKARRIPVKVRPHPLDKHFSTGLIQKQPYHLTEGTLEEALARASWVVCYNSNSAVDSVLAGKPTVTMDKGSMAWEITSHDPFNPPAMDDRSAWASKLAWTQWSMKEIRNGDAWDHLKVGMQL